MLIISFRFYNLYVWLTGDLYGEIRHESLSGVNTFKANETAEKKLPLC